MSREIEVRVESLSSLKDRDLLSRMNRIAAAERTVSVYALAHLAEIQRRKAYREAGFPSMFAYCVGALHYSEANAYRRLQAAEAARRHPEILSLIKDGGITICALSIIAKHLTQENCESLLKRIEGKSVRVVERIIAELAPLPDTRDMIRALPAPASPPTACEIPIESGPVAAPLRRAPQKIMPRALDRVLFRFTGSEELRRVIDRCTELLWHKHPEGRLEDILLEVGSAYLRLKDPELLRLSKPRPARVAESRVPPRWVKTAVYRRDGGRCVFTNAEGRRCEARRGLEYDHILPWALGGRSDEPNNIRLLCRAHNQLAAAAAGLGEHLRFQR